MTADQLLAWVDTQLRDYAPIDANAGEIRNRFSGLLHGRKGGVFGFKIPTELAAAVERPIAERFEAALAAWKQFLSNIDGGADYYQRSLAAAGLAAPPPRNVVTDPEIDRAAAALRASLADLPAATALWRARGWLEDDDELAYAFGPVDPGLSELLARYAASGIELPAQLEALYARIGGLWVDGDETGGERVFDPDEEYFTFAPLTTILERVSQNLDTIVLDQHPDRFSWVEMDRETGKITRADKLDRTPKPVADTLVQYLELLAKTYGHRG